MCGAIGGVLGVLRLADPDDRLGRGATAITQKHCPYCHALPRSFPAGSAPRYENRPRGSRIKGNCEAPGSSFRKTTT